MPDITQPLRLAVGSHKAGSGMGCAMNVVSWENGDSVITDFPACSDRVLARLVQMTNDTICTHRAVKIKFDSGLESVQDPLLCVECSAIVLDLGHRTVGTSLPLDRATRVYLSMAKDLMNEILSRESGSTWYDNLLSEAYHRLITIMMGYQENLVVETAVSFFSEASRGFEHQMPSWQYNSLLIDLYFKYAGLEPVEIAPEVTEQAVVKMMTKV